MRERLCIGQTWRRRRDGQVFNVRMVWRADRLALMVGDEKMTVDFTTLRRKFELVA
jgi:hypothetical protein